MGDAYREPAWGVQGSRHGPFLWPNNTLGGERGLHWVRGCREDQTLLGAPVLQGPEETQLWPLVVQCRMTQADFTEEAALSLPSTYRVLGTGMRTSIPGAEDSPSQGRQAVAWT